ncbi:replication protein RepA [Burkholderia ubonensis]|uniref:replication protein RepA n=1 Tax=Burkholderia ubonensis TaxID=101571 RepID=UPI000754BB70|nr:replication protein RepA [Burkholderia ubonensis]KVL70335.1 replication protein [Burkholderia ubonensis]KVL73198.1 replication protein [Burkholderia ubonensis]KVL91026.1 replication protein [Burkholderia ubonensis]
MTRPSEQADQLAPDGLLEWRQGYRKYLESHGVPPDAAAEVAAKVAYRSDLYPLEQTEAPSPTQRELSTASTTPPTTGKKKEKSAEPTTIPSKPKNTPTTKREERLILTGAEIAGERPDDDDRGYMHSIMCQVGLPRSKVDGTSFERHSGGAALLVEAGKLWDGKQFVQQPIPYGAMPRLMLAWMNTYAVRFNSPEIPVGDSATDFLRMLGHKNINGGERGSYTTFRKQVQALSACRMTLGFNANGRAHTYEGKPIKHFDAWLSPTDEKQRPLWPGTVTFSQDYYETLKDHAVPLDLRAFMSLKGSALDLDVYTWLAQRLHRIEGRPIVLYWANLRDQFGQEYQGKEADKDFKKKFLPSLRRVLTVYPDAKVKQVTGGVMMMASPPPIPYKGA